MAIVSMKQQTTIYRASNELDAWGNPLSSPPEIVKCRVDEGSFVTTDVQSSQTGKSVVASAKILYDGLLSLGYDDEIEYTNEINETIKRNPSRISVKRNIAGKPILTEVLL